MAKPQQKDDAPPSNSAPQQRQYSRTTSEAATLNPLPYANSYSKSSTDATAATDTNPIAAPRPAHVHNHGPSRSISNGTGQNVLSPSSHPISRGKDWESYYTPHTNKVESIPPEVRKPLKKTGMFHRNDGLHSKPASGGSHPSSRQKIPLSFQPQDAQARFVPSLVISGVQEYLDYSPIVPRHELEELSPVSIGPQSGETTPANTAAPTHPPSPDHNGLPKYVPAFDYAMRPFLDALVDDAHEKHLRLPPPVLQDTCTGGASPNFLLLHDDASTTYDSDEEEGDTPEYNIPSHLLEKDAFRTRMRHIQLRTYLMQCTILHNTVTQVQRKPWRSEREHSPRWYYEKMRSLAYKARPFAEALGSRDLQARCEYWAGRGCGGTRDYQAAEAHFKRALLLDEPNDTYLSGKPRLRGLLPTEKVDVRFLLDSCSARHRSWEKRMKIAMETAQYQSDATGLPIQACLDDQLALSPAWVPDRDRIVQLARETFGDQDKRAKSSVDWRLEQMLEDEVQARWKLEDDYLQTMKRRVLNKKEWQYIKNGDIRAAEVRTRQQSIDQVTNDALTRPMPAQKQSTVTSERSSSESFKTSSPTGPRTLANELEGLEWQSTSPIRTPTLSQCSSPSQQFSNDFEQRLLIMSQTLEQELKEKKDQSTSTQSFKLTSPPVTSLRRRRQVSLDPINTGKLPSRPQLGSPINGFLLEPKALIKPSSAPAYNNSFPLLPGPTMPNKCRSVSIGGYQEAALVSSMDLTTSISRNVSPMVSG